MDMMLDLVGRSAWNEQPRLAGLLDLSFLGRFGHGPKVSGRGNRFGHRRKAMLPGGSRHRVGDPSR
jgi:hypothetical protein